MNNQVPQGNDFINFLVYPVIVGILVGIILYILKKLKIIKYSILKFRYKLFPLKASIVYSLEYKEGLKTETYFKELKKEINSLSERTGILSKITIKDISGIYNIGSKIEGEEFLLNKKIDLLIWGRFSSDGLKVDGEIINVPEFNFQYRLLTDAQNKIKDMFEKDVNSRVALLKFNPIKERNDLNDIKDLSKNIFNTSIYILGVILKLYGKFKESTNYFERLYHSIPDESNAFKKSILPHLKNNYEVLMEEVANSTNPNILDGLIYSERYLKFYPNNPWVICNIAFYRYNLGHVEEADKLIEQAFKLDPSFPLCQLNMAFKKIREKNYKYAFKLYDKFFNMKIEKLEEIKFSLIEVVDFLEGEFQKSNDPAFLYGSAILNFNFGDIDTGKKDFKRFLDNANPLQMKEMIRKAKSLIK